MALRPQQLRVLVVEDYEEWAVAVSIAICRLHPGAKVRVVGTAAEAARELARGETDLVVADLMLRGVGTGADVARSAAARGLPCILTTSHARGNVPVPAGVRYVHKDGLMEALPGFLLQGPRALAG